MLPSAQAHLTVAAASHAGMSGKNNEDRYGVSAYRINDAARTPSVFAIVADGIGGHRAGEIAAEIVVETISEHISEANVNDPLNALTDALVAAGRAVFSASEQFPERQGMGSTCACAWVIGERLYTASVGDSRIYLVRNHTIRRLSTDHTWIQEAMDHGALTAEQARNHPNAHVIRRYLGSKQDVVPDLRLKLRADDDDARALANQGTHLLTGDVLLLCSDGLTDLVEDAEILAALQKENLEAALDDLIDMANRRGGHDNITLVAMRAPAPPRQTVAVQPSGTSIGARTCLILVTLLAGLVLLVGSVYWFILRPAGEGGLTEPLATQTAAPSATYTSAVIQEVTPEAPTETALPAVSPTPTAASPLLTLTATAPIATLDGLEATLTPWPTNTLTP